MLVVLEIERISKSSIHLGLHTCIGYKRVPIGLKLGIFYSGIEIIHKFLGFSYTFTGFPNLIYHFPVIPYSNLTIGFSLRYRHRHCTHHSPIDEFKPIIRIRVSIHQSIPYRTHESRSFSFCIRIISIVNKGIKFT